MTVNVSLKNVKIYLFFIAISITLFSSMTMTTPAIAQQVNTVSGFDAPITLDEVDAVGFDTSIAIGVDGNPVISYRDLTNEDLKLVHCMNPSCTAFTNPVTLDDDGMVGRDSSIVIGTDNNPVISYFDNSNNDLKMIHCTTINCSTSNSPITLDSDGAVGRDTSIAIGVDGNPVISYRASTDGNLKMVHCTSIDCSTQDNPMILDSNGSVGFDTSMTISVEGYPIVSYFDNTNANLKLVHCTSVNCSTQDNPMILDSVDTVGRDSSIAIGVDGYPVISYIDDTFGNLKLIHCINTNCSHRDMPIILDNDDAVGITTSIAIGVDGYPIVSYFDAVTSNLKIVHCTTTSCSTIFDNTF